MLIVATNKYGTNLIQVETKTHFHLYFSIYSKECVFRNNHWKIRIYIDFLLDYVELEFSWKETGSYI